MFLPELMSFVAAILFSVHPIHTEAVRYLISSTYVPPVPNRPGDHSSYLLLYNFDSLSYAVYFVNRKTVLLISSSTLDNVQIASRSEFEELLNNDDDENCLLSNKRFLISLWELVVDLGFNWIVSP